MSTHRLAGFERALILRSRLHHAVREFFFAQSYIEVDTPIRIPVPAMEEHIDAEPSGTYYLRTSPELHMKRLVCAGHRRLFQIGPCFRQGERGTRHNPEYTMLEWYHGGEDYTFLIRQTQEMLRFCAQSVFHSTTFQWKGVCCDLSDEWAIYPICDLFRMHAGWDPATHFDADRFEIDLMERIEPALPTHIPVILKDYPVQMGALAKRNQADPSLAQRWELYLCGVEVANAYTELTDAKEQRQRFETWAQSRSTRGAPVYPLDEAFLMALEDGMPDVAGIAMGMDRLLMLLGGFDSFDDLFPFRNDETRYP